MKKLLFIFLLLIFSSCHLIKPNSAIRYQYRARISPDFVDGNKIILSLQTVDMASGYNINFNRHDYGKFITAAPQLQPQMGLVLDISAPASGELSLVKSDEYHLIFFFYDKREEFLIKIKSNLVRVKPLTRTRYIHFDNEPVYLIPENTLTITMRGNRKMPDTINDQLVKLNLRRLQLPLGNYRGFTLTSYSEQGNYAHISAPTNPKYTPLASDTSIFYFFEIKNNFGKVDSSLKTFNANTQPISSRYRYNYNFNIEDRIYGELNPGPIPITIKLPDNHNPYKSMNLYKESIDFEIKETQEVKMIITNTRGEMVKEILLRCDASGKISYQWDGIKDDGREAESGVYFYRILSDDTRLGIGTFILRQYL